MELPSCQYCGCEIEGKAAFCTACETPHHRDCFEENGKCTVYACDCPSFFDAAQGKTVHLKKNWTTEILDFTRNESNSPIAIDAYDDDANMNKVLVQVGAIIAVLFFFTVSATMRYADSSSRASARSTMAGSSYKRDRWGAPKRRKQPKRKKIDWSDIRTLKGTLSTAIMRRDIPLATRMLNMGAPPNGKWFGGYPLERAARKRDLEMCRLLVKYGARPRTGEISSFLRSHGISIPMQVERVP